MIKLPNLNQLMAYAISLEALAEQLHRAVPYFRAFLLDVAPAGQKLIAGLKNEFHGSLPAPGATTSQKGAE